MTEFKLECSLSTDLSIITPFPLEIISFSTAIPVYITGFLTLQVLAKIFNHVSFTTSRVGHFK